MNDEQLFLALPNCVDEIDLQLDAPRYDGKVRSVYDLGGRLLMATSDRVSAFDTILGLIPYKGQVLNQLSAWWFEKNGRHRAKSLHLRPRTEPNGDTQSGDVAR